MEGYLGLRMSTQTLGQRKSTSSPHLLAAAPKHISEWLATAIAFGKPSMSGFNFGDSFKGDVASWHGSGYPTPYFKPE